MIKEDTAVMQQSIEALLARGKSQGYVLKKMAGFGVVEITGREIMLQWTENRGDQRCKGSFSYVKELREARRLKAHNKFCKRGQLLYNRKEIRLFAKTTVNQLRVDKEVERTETEEIQAFMNSLTDASKPDVKSIEIEEIPSSQKDWEESKEGTKGTEREEWARKGGSLMQRFRDKLRQKQENKQSTEHKRMAIHKADQFLSSKRKKTDEDDELPLFFDS